MDGIVCIPFLMDATTHISRGPPSQLGDSSTALHSTRYRSGKLSQNQLGKLRHDNLSSAVSTERSEA